MFGGTSPDKLVKLTGATGTVYAADPYRCFHFGARSQKKPRLVLIMNFTTAFGPLGHTPVCRCKNRSVLNDGNPRTRLLLAL